MPYFKLINVAANKALNIKGTSISNLSDSQNVILWDDTGTPEQTWFIDALGYDVLVKSAVNMGFALNVKRSANPKNCDVFPWSGNETDAMVSFEAASGGYRIKLVNYDLYLTGGGTANGANVYWAGATWNNDQVWTCVEVEKPGPQNQTYETSNGLRILTTHARNIRLNQNTNGRLRSVRASNCCGINGAWYDRGAGDGILNVAVQDGQYVGPGDRGSYNRVGGCIIAWNGSSMYFDCGVNQQVGIPDISFLLNAGSPYLQPGTWIQGGSGLWLGDKNWLKSYEAQDDGQSMEYYNAGAAQRSGLIAILSGPYAGTIKLVTTINAMNVENFRAAIQKYLGITDGPQHNTMYQAIMLDGGSSTQMAAKNVLGTTVYFPTSQANVPQIITLINPN